MPIDIDQFEAGDGVPVRPETNKGRVLAFLAANPEQAFRPSEVAEGAGVNPNSVGTVLSRLEDDGLVRHRDGYWAVGETDPVAEFVDALRDLGDAAEDLATEEVDRLLSRIRG